MLLFLSLYFVTAVMANKDLYIAFSDTLAQMFMALHDKLNVSNTPSDLKYHDENLMCLLSK